MPDSVRPGHPDHNRPSRLSVITTISLDVELVLLDAHPAHPRIDTVVRHGNNVSVIFGTPATPPVPVRLGPDFTRIAEVYIPAAVPGVWPGQITNLRPGAPDFRKTR